MQLRELLAELSDEDKSSEVIIRDKETQNTYDLDFVEYERVTGTIVLVTGEEYLI